jgi:hypothetical protein
MPSCTTFPLPPSAPAPLIRGHASTCLLSLILSNTTGHVLGLGETVEVLHLAIADLSERADQVIRDSALEAEVAGDRREVVAQRPGPAGTSSDQHWWWLMSRPSRPSWRRSLLMAPSSSFARSGLVWRWTWPSPSKRAPSRWFTCAMAATLSGVESAFWDRIKLVEMFSAGSGGLALGGVGVALGESIWVEYIQRGNASRISEMFAARRRDLGD